MARQAGKSQKGKLRPLHIYTIISIALVLFMLGILGTILLYAQELSRYFRENIEVSVIMKDDVNQTEAMQFEKRIASKEFVKATEYVSKEDAAEKLKEQLGEDFLDLLEYNPLYASINLNLHAPYAHADSIASIKKELRSFNQVQDVNYQAGLVQSINKNLRNISIVIGAISILLFFIVITLIDNTLRLSMYSNRFLIKSMQLVGATRWFIIKPFLGRGVLNGFISGIIANIGLAGLLYYAQRKLPELMILHELVTFAALFGAIILVGVLLTWLSSYFAVRKYLRMKLDDLY
ncbi:MAG: cell division protein FtsX [Bacteroidetes bacterium SW_11_45_7]|nr:MAG: cell division protein FtsX [Bacteroidetes bacterium SW_11_45_7]